MTVCTQWRTGPMGDIIALDYAGVAAGLSAAGIELTQELFASLQEMEAAAVDWMARRRKRQGHAR